MFRFWGEFKLHVWRKFFVRHFGDRQKYLGMTSNFATHETHVALSLIVVVCMFF